MPTRKRVNVHTLVRQEQEPSQVLPTESETQAQANTPQSQESQTSKAVQSDAVKQGKMEEKLVTKLSVCLEDEPYIEKLDRLKKEYRKRTRKGTDYNKIIRMLIEKATIDDLF